MTTFRTVFEPKPDIVCDGATCISVEYSNTVNEGVKASATVLGVYNETAGAEHHISVCGNPLPPFLATGVSTKSVAGIGTTTYSGIDKPSYLLGAKGLSIPTMHNTTGGAAIAAIANLVGAQVTVGGNVYSMQIEEFDMQGGKLGEYIAKLLQETGCDWYIDNDGVMQICDFGGGPGGTYGTVGEVETKSQLLGLYTDVILRKVSKQSAMIQIPVNKGPMGQGDLGPTGLLQPYASIEPGGAGSVGYVAFFTSSGGDGKLCGYQAVDPMFAIGGASYAGVSALSGPVISGEPAKFCVFEVLYSQMGGAVNFTLTVRGKIPTSGGVTYDPSFKVTSQANGQGNVTNKLTMTSTLWPTQHFANIIAPNVLGSANRHASLATYHCMPNIIPTLGGIVESYHVSLSASTLNVEVTVRA